MANLLEPQRRSGNVPRLATLEDAEAIGALMRLTAASHAPSYFDARTAELIVDFFTDPDLDLIRDGTFYVVEEVVEPLQGAADESNVLGLRRLAGCGGWSARKRLFSGGSEQEALSAQMLDPKVDSAKIRAFYVHPECGRQGVGSAIYWACEAAAKKSGFRSLELASSPLAVTFYERFGFERLEMVDAEIGDGCVVSMRRMRKSLS